MLVMGAIMLRKGKKLDGAKWYGKVCTALLFLVMFVLLVIPMLRFGVVSILVAVCAIWMLITLLLYIVEFVKMWRK